MLKRKNAFFSRRVGGPVRTLCGTWRIRLSSYLPGKKCLNSLWCRSGEFKTSPPKDEPKTLPGNLGLTGIRSLKLELLGWNAWPIITAARPLYLVVWGRSPIDSTALTRGTFAQEYTMQSRPSSKTLPPPPGKHLLRGTYAPARTGPGIFTWAFLLQISTES